MSPSPVMSLTKRTLGYPHPLPMSISIASPNMVTQFTCRSKMLLVSILTRHFAARSFSTYFILLYQRPNAIDDIRSDTTILVRPTNIRIWNWRCVARKNADVLPWILINITWSSDDNNNNHLKSCIAHNDVSGEKRGGWSVCVEERNGTITHKHKLENSKR